MKKKYKITYTINNQEYSYIMQANDLQHCRNLVFYRLKTEILETIQISELN